MATIRFVYPADKVFERASDYVERGVMTQETFERMPEGERRMYGYYHHRGSKNEPQLVELKLEPGLGVESHAHEVDEIFAVVAGELHFGNRVCGAGSSVCVPRLTLYSFVAGPDGCTVLNFRPTGDFGYIPKDELIKRQKAAQETSS
jgi:mannose-6-phosphate isomerase-like protein (cupin superfamily)